MRIWSTTGAVYVDDCEPAQGQIPATLGKFSQRHAHFRHRAATDLKKKAVID